VKASRPSGPEADRARAHLALDRLLDLLAAHPPSSGALRIRVDRQGHLHLEWHDVVAELDGLLTRGGDGSTL
jgi:hypothetical protein